MYLDMNVDSLLVDPRLRASFHGSLRDEPWETAFAISPSIWNQELDTFLLLVGDQINIGESIEAKDYSNTETIAIVSSHDAGTNKASRALSYSSSLSITSPASSQASYQTQEQTHKQRKKKRQLQIN